MQTLGFASITKYFPGAAALDNVSFDIRAGECHALVGENGAGKSTLGKILAGIYQADKGSILVDGTPVHFSDPHEAKQFGISMVHQELLFCPNLPVAENLFLGNLPSKSVFVDYKALERKARELLAEIGVELDIWQAIENISIARKQMAQIAGAVGAGAKVIVMDEPSSSLTQAEVDKLYDLLRLLKKRGVTVIYVSHRMEEVFIITDSITVLRDGKYIQTLSTSQTSEDEIVTLMVGRSIDKYFPRHLDRQPGSEVLRVEHLTVPGQFEDISFSLKAGEILGLGGLVGAGRSEVACALFGLEPEVKGDIYVHGRKVVLISPSVAMALGIGLVPEDRKLQGLVLEMSAGQNLSLPKLTDISRFGFIQRNQEKRVIGDYFNRLGVKPDNPSALAATFSGGNQQKVVLSKWLARNCDILIIDEPTRGIDVKAKAEIHTLVDRLASEGKGIILISSDLPELLNLSTRILILREGRCKGEIQREHATQENLMRLMAGVV